MRTNKPNPEHDGAIGDPDHDGGFPAAKETGGFKLCGYRISKPTLVDINPAKIRFVVAGNALLVNELTSLQTAAVITPAERELLEMYPAKDMGLLLHTWSLRAVRQLMLSQDEESEGKYDKAAFEQLYKEVKKPVDELLVSCQKITQEMSLPVPFPYFHAVVLLMAVNYLTLCISLLGANSVISPIILLMLMLVTTGLREVAAMLSNPFGTDPVDFPVNEWLTEMRGIVGLMVFRKMVIGLDPSDSSFSAKSKVGRSGTHVMRRGSSSASTSSDSLLRTSVSGRSSPMNMSPMEA
jgi:hypothetical protein